MITRHAPVLGGPNYRVLVLHLVSDLSPAILAAAFAELKARGVSVDETVVMDVTHVNVLPVLLSGAIRTKAYDAFVAVGAAAFDDPSAAALIPTAALLTKLVDIAVIRATPLGVGVCAISATPEQAERAARRAVLDSLESANAIDTVDEL